MCCPAASLVVYTFLQKILKFFKKLKEVKPANFRENSGEKISNSVKGLLTKF